MNRSIFRILSVLVLAMVDACGGEPGPVVTAESEGPSFSASITGYSIPDDEDYLSPLIMGDFGSVHFEARYQYEDMETTSLWLGWNFSAGSKITLDFTPMIGAVFGETKGLAPGWRLAVAAGDFEFTNESEYVFDAADSENNFFYMWSELTWSPTEKFWIGLAGQRTRLFETGLDVQRGFLAGFSIRDVEVSAYVFNWGWEDPAFVLSVGWNF